MCPLIGFTHHHNCGAYVNAQSVAMHEIHFGGPKRTYQALFIRKGGGGLGGSHKGPLISV